MDFIRGQNTAYFSWDLNSKYDYGPVKLLELSRNGPLDTFFGKPFDSTGFNDNVSGKATELTLKLTSTKTHIPKFVKFYSRRENIFIYSNWPFYSCLLSDLASEWQQGWSWPCSDTDLTAFIMQIKLFLC